MTTFFSVRNVPSFALLLASIACSPSGGPQTGTQTNWLRVCAIDEDCDSGTQCLCQTCTHVPDPAGCDDLPEASAVASDDDGAIALCGGTQAKADKLCLILCDEGMCPDGTSCVAGICAPTREPTATVSIDTSNQYQSLVGFGAGIAYIEQEIAAHPRKAALYDAMFKTSGFRVLRLRNQYDATKDTDFTSILDVVEGATARIGQAPTVLLTSASPPAGLKESGETFCSGNADTCTLNRADDGGFNYKGLAEHFAGSLSAYASAGIAIDFLSIQNNPNWVPPAGRSIESCLFLPHEGMTTVVVDGADLDLELPGYTEALDTIVEAIADLPNRPLLLGPETTGLESSADYIRELDLSQLDAAAHHLYGVDPFAPDPGAFETLSDLAQAAKLPLFQSEMAGDGLETALLMQESLVDSQASMYLQTGFVAPAGLTEPDKSALIGLTDTDFVLQDPYYALKHFAQGTEPGWSRVAATIDRDSVRVSAWLSPDEQRMTIILVNPQTIEEVVDLDMEDLGESSLTRTVFTGVERFADLGRLSPGDTFALPANSIVTLSIQK